MELGAGGPAYLELYRSGELRQWVADAYGRLRSCDLGAGGCGVKRREGELGACRTGERAVVSGHHAHFGDEDPLVGRRGSGTAFFAWCNLRVLPELRYQSGRGWSRSGGGRHCSHDARPSAIGLS